MANLKQFVRTHCANWDRNDCVFGECKIMEGKPCTYFEVSVWGIGDPNYPYATHTEGYGKRMKEYLALRKDFRGYKKAERYCDCGQALQLKKRICDICAKKRVRGDRVFSVRGGT